MSFIIDQEFSFNTNAELKKYKKKMTLSKAKEIIRIVLLFGKRRTFCLSLYRRRKRIFATQSV